MRKEIKRFRILILGLSILMSFCLAYPQYDSLGEIRFLSLDLILGNADIADQDDFVSDPPPQSEGIVSTSSVNLGHLGIHPFQDSSSFPFQLFFFEPRISILRC